MLYYVTYELRYKNVYKHVTPQYLFISRKNGIICYGRKNNGFPTIYKDDKENISGIIMRPDTFLTENYVILVVLLLPVAHIIRRECK